MIRILSSALLLPVAPAWVAGDPAKPAKPAKPALALVRIASAGGRA